MTYLAPRQGLFAIIIIISFFIHTTLLLISTDQQLDKLKLQTGERMLTQLIEEVKLPLLSKDKVSLSVLTKRYTSENNVASITVQDIDDDVVLQTGDAQLLKGDKISRSIVMGDTDIGQVTLTLRETSNGEIIASQWVFILGSALVHLLLWLIYGYVARPTKAQLAALSRDIQDHILSQPQSRINNRARRNEHLTDPSGHSYNLLNNDEEVNQGQNPPLNVKKAVNDYVKSHQAEGVDAELPYNTDGSQSSANSIDSSRTTGGTHQAIHQSGVDQHEATQEGTQAPVAQESHKKLLATRPLDVASVQIRYDDPYNLIDTLAPEQSRPYFALCTQLLQQTLIELMKQPIMFGVKVKNKPVFDADGAVIEFYGTTEHSKIALAAVMLAKSYVMLNQIICLKHRELKRFSSDVYIGVSDEAVTEQMQHLLNNNAKADDVLILLPIEGIKQLSGHIQLDNLANPTSVYERDCAYFDGASDLMMQRLVQIRNAVLLSGQQ